MERTRRNLEKALVKSVESKYFLTEDALNNVLTQDIIRECIEQADIDVLLKRNCIEAVFEGGKKVLALLIMQNRVGLLAKFVETDHSSKSGHLDSRLPFEQQTLTRILMDDGDAIFNIQRHQWELMAPYFQEGRAHRIYQTDVIMPFVQSKWIGAGGFGDVYEVSLPNSHHGFGFQGGNQVRDTKHSVYVLNTLQVTIVRKLLRSEIDTHEVQDSFQNEKEILSLLKSLRHENIIELLASYTVLNDPPEYNFLFPRADTTLSKVLRDKERDALRVFFPSEHALLEQLYGLSSAIDSLHRYFSPEYYLALIGCHYDLAPRNVLIRQRKLLLADFGLSRLRPGTSKSIFAAGKGDYLAPECEPLQDGTFSRGIMGRASDIWSFGCIILEIFIHNVHAKNKAQAIEDFQKKRRTTLWGGDYTTYLFHCYDKPNPAVTETLDSLSSQVTGSRRNHLTLIREMLALAPDDRPTAGRVTVQIFLQAQETVFNTACDIFKTNESVQEGGWTGITFEIERMRFLLWGWGAKLIEDCPGFEVPAHFGNDSLRKWLWDSRQIFAEVNRLLLAFLVQLDIIKADKNSNKALPRRIRWRHLQLLNDGLWALPPRPLLHTMNSVLENHFLSIDDRDTRLELYEMGLGDALSTDLALLSEIKFMTAKVHSDQQNVRNTLLLKDQVPVSTTLGIHRFGTMNDTGGVEKSVLIEQISYDPNWLGEHDGNELYGRAEALAKLLNNPEMLGRFRVLQCTGYFLDLPHSAISLIYDFPPQFSPSLRPVSLKNLILGRPRPDLGILFNLALVLARCVLSFHKTGWLHKNISSLNVLFFDSDLSQAYLAPTKTLTRKLQPMATDRDEKHILQSTSQVERKTLHKWSFKRFSKKASVRELDSQSSAFTSKIAFSPSSTMDPHCAKTDKDSQRESIEEVAPLDLGLALQQPYMVGFDHSRLDNEMEFTSGPSHKQSQKPYQHPRHRGSNLMHRYHPEYDYYSIGVVLLELASWKPIEAIVQANGDGRLPENTNPKWLLEVVPWLGSTMGAVYRDAVTACLNGELASPDAGLRPMELFEALVVNRIERCSA